MGSPRTHVLPRPPLVVVEVVVVAVAPPPPLRPRPLILIIAVFSHACGVCARQVINNYLQFLKKKDCEKKTSEERRKKKHSFILVINTRVTPRSSFTKKFFCYTQ